MDNQENPILWKESYHWQFIVTDDRASNYHKYPPMWRCVCVNGKRGYYFEIKILLFGFFLGVCPFMKTYRTNNGIGKAAICLIAYAYSLKKLFLTSKFKSKNQCDSGLPPWRQGCGLKPARNYTVYTSITSDSYGWSRFYQQAKTYLTDTFNVLVEMY